jgi:hypothetical protein
MISLEDAVKRFADEGVYNKEHDVCRFFPNTTAPFVKGHLFRQAHEDLALKMKMVAIGVDEFTPLEHFAIKVLIIHLEEFLGMTYDAQQGGFVQKE